MEDKEYCRIKRSDAKKIFDILVVLNTFLHNENHFNSIQSIRELTDGINYPELNYILNDVVYGWLSEEEIERIRNM